MASSSTRPSPSRPMPTTATNATCATRMSPRLPPNRKPPRPSLPGLPPKLPMKPLPMPRIGSCRVVLIRKAPFPGALSSSHSRPHATVAMTAVRVIAASSAGVLHDHHPRPIGHQDHPRPQRRLQRRPPRDLHRRVRREERRTRPVRRRQVRGRFRHRRDSPVHVHRQRPHGHRNPRPPGRDDLVQHRCPEPRRRPPAESTGSRSDRRGSADRRTDANDRPKAAGRKKVRSPRDPLVDTTPFGSEPAAASAEASADATMAATRRCSARSGRWAMSSSSMPPWIGVCCVSSATASVISATSSHRCPRTGTSPGSDSHRRLARHSTHRGSSPVGGAPVSFSQGDRHATCIPLRSSLPGVALKSPAVG